MSDSNPLRDNAVSLVQHAILSPSLYNTQPWLFRISGTGIDLLADRRRSLPVADPDDRQLTISCGCALFNLRVTAAALGLGIAVELLPDPGEPECLARIHPDPRCAPPHREGRLAVQIGRRRTFDRRFLPIQISSNTTENLVDSVRPEGAWLRPLLHAEQRDQLAWLVAEGSFMHWADPYWRHERAAWIHPRWQGDGLSVSLPAVAISQYIVRTFDMGIHAGSRERKLVHESPLLAVLGTEYDTPRDWLVAGQALQRLLLTACWHNQQASYLNQPVQLALLRPKLQQLAGDGFPQVVLRLGYPAYGTRASPRRPLEAVIDMRP